MLRPLRSRQRLLVGHFVDGLDGDVLGEGDNLHLERYDLEEIRSWPPL